MYKHHKIGAYIKPQGTMYRGTAPIDLPLAQDYHIKDML